MKAHDETSALYVKNFIFGVEDSLVSTTGLLSGIAAAGVDRETIFLTGVVLIFVEAFSMAAGSFLSESSAEEYMKHSKKHSNSSILGALIMFFSYFAAGFIPLFPYMVFDVSVAFWVAIILALSALFLLGIVSAKLFGAKVMRSGIRMLVIGGIAVVAGVMVGNLVNGRN